MSISLEESLGVMSNTGKDILKFTDGRWWKPLVDDRVQERYAISCFGEVIDLKRVRYKNQHDQGGGYLTVGLMPKDGQNSITLYVHRAVAKAFIDNQGHLPQVGHRDHDKKNNNLSNLYWTTPKQNTKDGIKDGRINSGKRGPQLSLTKGEICLISVFSKSGKGVNEIAVVLGRPRTTISSVFNGRSNASLFEFIQKSVTEGEVENSLFAENYLREYFK